MTTKDLEEIVYEPTQCRRELAAFQKLLQSKKQLDERADILPFFRKRKQLSAFLGAFAPNIGPATHLAFEYPFMGDLRADIILGNKEWGAFCAIEFEDGKSNSIFTKRPKKSTTEWSSRFERGFSQLVDWFYALDDFKKTERFAKDFGYGHITFNGLLIIGRTAGLTVSDRNRLKWRTEKVRVDSHTIECLTLDDLYQFLEMRISFYPAVSKLKK
jgi:hypothetical protein